VVTLAILCLNIANSYLYESGTKQNIRLKEVKMVKSLKH